MKPSHCPVIQEGVLIYLHDGRVMVASSCPSRIDLCIFIL